MFKVGDIVVIPGYEKTQFIVEFIDRYGFLKISSDGTTLDGAYPSEKFTLFNRGPVNTRLKSGFDYAVPSKPQGY